MITKQMLDAYFEGRTWYEKAQTTDAGQDSMYNQGRVAVRKLLDSFEAMFVAPIVVRWPQDTYPLNPVTPWVSPGTGPHNPFEPQIICGPQRNG